MPTVLITGCSTGIGRETALLFREKGWAVAATMRNPAEEAGFRGLANLNCYAIDVTSRESIAAGVAGALRDFGSIDALVNNAGVYGTMPLELAADHEIANLIDTNVRGTIDVTRALLPHFRKQRRGTILNVSSIAGRTTFPYQTVYHGTKWAIEGITESLRYELRNLGVIVKLVEPGMVKTNLYDTTWVPTCDDLPKEYRPSFTRWHRFLRKSYERGYSPRRDAETIFRAATDGRAKLRYTTDVTTRLLLLMRSLLPQRMLTYAVRSLCGV